MSGDIWKFSDQIDDVDVEMLRHDFITLREGMEYYQLNEKPMVRLAREAGAVYKIGKMVGSAERFLKHMKHGERAEHGVLMRIRIQTRFPGWISL